MSHLPLVELAHHVEVGKVAHGRILDVLVEGNEQVTAAVQDTADRTRRSDELRAGHVADDGYLVALVVDFDTPLVTHGDGAENVGLVIVVGGAQVEGVVQCLRSHQRYQLFLVLAGILHPLLQSVEVGIILTLVLQAYALQ